MAALQQARADSGIIGLQTVVQKVKPTILIGTSTTHGAFTREVVEAMSAGVSRPVIFPLSNPTSKIEAMPADIITWSKGRALVATGLSIGPFDYDGVTHCFGQANNARTSGRRTQHPVGNLRCAGHDAPPARHRRLEARLGIPRRPAPPPAPSGRADTAQSAAASRPSGNPRRRCPRTAKARDLASWIITDASLDGRHLGAG
jgi:hypothetical protein